MDFYNVLKTFLGIPNSVPPPDLRFDDGYTDERAEVIRPPRAQHPDDESMWSSFMSDPRDFQNFVEEQMQQIMSSFGFAHTGTQFGESFADTRAPLSLREHYLKPGYDHPSSNKADTDLDGKVNLDELDTMLKPAPPIPEQPMSVAPSFKSHVFGQSVSTRTIVNPDGTVETTRTVRDNKGNKETTVTRQDHNTQYTITTRIDADGVETKEEELVNLPEGAHGPITRAPHPPGSPSWLEMFFKQ